MKYSDLAKDAPICFGCRTPADDTLVLAHRNRGGWGLLFGRSVKALSLSGAILCGECHTYGDGEGRRDSDWWELACQRTQTWAWESGFVRFDPKGGEPDGRLR